MDDGQFPPESGDAKGAAARRSRTRLSDVETVATARLDMFGDNSLKEALTGRRPDPNDGEAPSVQALPADAEPPTTDEPPAADTDAEPSPEPADAQHLDAAADAATEPSGPDNANAHAVAPDAPFEASDADRLFAPAPDATGATSPMPEVSSIFDALEAIEREAGELLQDRPASEADSQDAVLWEAEPPADARPIRMEVSSIFDALDEAERRLDGEGAAPDAAEPEAPASGEVNGWRAAPEELIGTVWQEGDAPAEDVPADAAAAGGAETVEAGEVSPPPEEPAAEEAAETASGDADPTSSQLSVGPPFPDPTGAAPADDLAHPPTFFRSELEPLEPPPPPPDMHAARIEAEATATAEVLENLQRMLDVNVPGATYAPPPPPPARPEWPREQVVSSASPLVGNFRAGPQPAPPPHYVGRSSAPLMPLPVLPQRPSRASIYALGFLAGLGLSLMAGLLLFFFIQLV